MPLHARVVLLVLGVALVVATAGCGGSIAPVVPKPGDPTLLGARKVTAAKVTISPKVAADRSKNGVLVDNEIPRKLEEAIMASMGLGNHADPSGGMTLEVEITQLRISRWTPANTMISTTRVLDRNGNELKSFESVSVSSRPSVWVLVNDLLRRIVDKV